MAQSPEVQQQIQIWRQKAREGTLTQDEMRQAIQLLRKDRTTAAGTSAASHARKATAKKPISSEDLLSELDNL